MKIFKSDANNYRQLLRFVFIWFQWSQNITCDVHNVFMVKQSFVVYVIRLWCLVVRSWAPSESWVDGWPCEGWKILFIVEDWSLLYLLILLSLNWLTRWFLLHGNKFGSRCTIFKSCQMVTVAIAAFGILKCTNCQLHGLYHNLHIIAGDGSFSHHDHEDGIWCIGWVHGSAGCIFEFWPLYTIID